MIIVQRVALTLFVLVTLSAACQAPSAPKPFSISTVTPGSTLNSTWTMATPESTEDYVISAMPHCRGLTDLRTKLVFDWPDIEEALEKLEEYNWGYYTCDVTQPALQTFLHDNMPKPPYLWREVNHANHNNGQVTLYYQPFSIVFMYIWTLPMPGTQTTYMIIARGDPGLPQTWECLKHFPKTLKVAFK